jgi:uncharacterized protein YgiM (DUF1202 family)
MSSKPINYNKISTENATAEPAAEVIEEVVETVVEPPVLEVKTGVVCKCSKLNVRAAADPNAKILGTLDAGTPVDIYGEEGEFYKIADCNEYCMKKYISVNR